MLDNLSDLTKTMVFYALTLGMMLAACLLYPVLGAAVVLVAMYTPLAATLLMLLVVTPDGRTKAGWASLGLHRLGLRLWPAAILIPLLVLGAAYGLVWASGLAGFSVPPLVEEVGLTLLPLAALYLIGMHLLTGAMGEEIGWRGYLLPRLAEALGPRWALPLTGFMQGVWHLPIILLTPLYHAEGNLLIVIPMFLVAVTIFGTIEGYLRLATNSVWPSAILHSAHNIFWSLLRMSTVAAPPLVTEYLAGESGILPMLSYALVVVAIVLHGRNALRRPQLAKD